MKILILIVLIFSGCTFVAKKEMNVCDKLCESNGGCKLVNKFWLFIIDPPKYNCNNGAKFESDMLEDLKEQK